MRPYRYRNVGVDALTTPPIIYEFTGSFGPEASSWEATGQVMYLGVETDQGVMARIVRAPLTYPGAEQIDEELAFDALTAHTMTDVIFSPLQWDPEDSELDQARRLVDQLAGLDRPLIRVIR